MKQLLAHGAVRQFSLVAVALIALSAQAAQVGKAKPTSLKDPSKEVKSKAEKSPGSLLLTYTFKLGETHRYQVTAFFDGHIPPFAQPGSKPVHLMVKFEYVTKTLKQDAKGTQIAFSVESADLNLLESESDFDTKIDPDSVTPFPIALSDVQKTLNATATLRPDGSIAQMTSEGPNIVRVNVGFDLRKLFQMLLPVIFKQTPVHVGDAWTQPAGLLGSNPGKTTYTDKLTSAGVGKQGTLLRLEQKGIANVEDTLDKEGNSAQRAEDVIGKLTGTVNIQGDMKFVADSTKASAASVRMLAGQFTLQAAFARTITKADVKPEIRQSIEGPIDVKARMRVVPDEKTASR